MEKLAVRRMRHLAWAALLATPSAFAQTLPITPLPASVTLGTGGFTVNNGAAIGVPAGDAGAAAAATAAQTAVETVPQVTLAPAPASAATAVQTPAG